MKSRYDRYMRFQEAQRKQALLIRTEKKNQLVQCLSDVSDHKDTYSEEHRILLTHPHLLSLSKGFFLHIDTKRRLRQAEAMHLQKEQHALSMRALVLLREREHIKVLIQKEKAHWIKKKKRDEANNA